MGPYTPQYPSSASELNPEILRFLEHFYALSDTPDTHAAYADCFTADAPLTMASNTVNGTAEIIALRKAMWEHVATRKHRPRKVFPFGQDTTELMLYGTVEYGMKNGKVLEVDWAARAELVLRQHTGEGDCNKRWQMRFYQVYMDSAAMSAASK